MANHFHGIPFVPNPRHSPCVCVLFSALYRISKYRTWKNRYNLYSLLGQCSAEIATRFSVRRAGDVDRRHKRQWHGDEFPIRNILPRNLLNLYSGRNIGYSLSRTEHRIHIYRMVWSMLRNRDMRSDNEQRRER